MENIQWIFEGFGTAIVTFILGLMAGGATGYKIAVKKLMIKQTQKAGDNSNQAQIGEIKNGK
jgi:mannose/fructose/N-acetylgalactosamine-specific phosphotransferase system component IIC